MAVYRVNKTRGYTVMANFHLRDKNLSLKAVGLLSKMLSFNDGWKFSTRGLAAICKEGPDAILTALRELEKNGYLVRHQERNANGRMGSMVFEIYEEPQEVLPDMEKPHTENPDAVNPVAEQSYTDNPAQRNTEQVINPLHSFIQVVVDDDKAIPLDHTIHSFQRCEVLAKHDFHTDLLRDAERVSRLAAPYKVAADLREISGAHYPTSVRGALYHKRHPI